MDYLHLLPIEIWRYILSQLPSHVGLSSELSNDPLAFFRIDEYGYVIPKSPQASRLYLSGICKSLQPLAEAIIYSEVRIFGKKKIVSFSKAVTTKSITGQRRGDWCLRLHFTAAFELGWEEIEALGSLIKACPNLTTLYLYGTWQRASDWMLGWKNTLKTLIWIDSSLSWHHIMLTAFSFADLNTLIISGKVAKETSEEELVRTSLRLPNLTRLYLPHEYVQSSALSRLKCPRLEWLYIPVPTRPSLTAIEQFVKRHSGSLRGLELGRRPAYPDDSLFAYHILDSSTLETLIMDAAWLRPAPRATRRGKSPTNYVKTLYLKGTAACKGGELREWLQDVKRMKCPNLEKVFIVPDEIPPSEAMRMEEFVQQPLIGVELTMKRYPSRLEQDN